MEEKKNKSRTAITIDPELWSRAKVECVRLSEARGGRKVSFSSLVEEALEHYFTHDAVALGVVPILVAEVLDDEDSVESFDEDSEWVVVEDFDEDRELVAIDVVYGDTDPEEASEFIGHDIDSGNFTVPHEGTPTEDV